MKFVLFTKAGCPPCVALKKVLTDLGVPFVSFSQEVERGTCEALGVDKFPTLIWWQNGEAGRMEGFSPRGLIAFMEEVERRR